jgi:phage-related protein
MREILFYKDYFLKFYESLSEADQEKIDFVLDLIQTQDRVPVTFLKHLEGTAGLYEIRVRSRGRSFRIFCFFDKGNLIVLLNSIEKKSERTSRKDLEQALRLQKEYFGHQKRSDKS